MPIIFCRNIETERKKNETKILKIFKSSFKVNNLVHNQNRYFSDDIMFNTTFAFVFPRDVGVSFSFAFRNLIFSIIENLVNVLTLNHKIKKKKK